MAKVTYTRGKVKERIKELKKGVTIVTKAYWKNGTVVHEIPDPLNPDTVRKMEIYVDPSLYDDIAFETTQVEKAVFEAKRDATWWQKLRGHFVGWNITVNLSWCKKKYQYSSDWKGREIIKEVK